MKTCWREVPEIQPEDKDPPLGKNGIGATARLAQSAERKAPNLVVVGSSPTVGVFREVKQT